MKFGNTDRKLNKRLRGPPQSVDRAPPSVPIRGGDGWHD